jgi:outer membrane protein assembly factor BamB
MFYIKRVKSTKSVIIAIVLISLVLSGCTGGRGWPGVVSDGETLFVGSMDGRVLALDLEGRVEWSWKPESKKSGGFLSCAGGGQFRAGSIYGPPSVADGVVFVASYNGKVYAIDIDDRYEKWSYDIDSALVGGVAIAGDTLFVGSSDGKLHALDVATGQPRWGFLFEAEDKIWSTPVVQDGTVYFGSLDKRLYAVDAGTGELKWAEPFETGGGIASPPLIVGGVVYVGSFDSKFYAIDADTGTQKWVFEGASDWYWSKALYHNGIIYACSLDNNVYAIHAGSGEAAWPRPFETAGPVKSSPVISGEVLVVASEKGEVYGIDLETGLEARRWQEADLDTKVLAPLYEYAGKVYINAQDNKLYIFDGATGKPDWPVSLEE